MKKYYIFFLSVFNFYFSSAQYVWTQKADFGGGQRYAAAGFSIGTKVFLGLGITHIGSNDTYYNDFWEWDQATNVWTQRATFPGAQRNSGAGFSIGQMGYVTLGWSPAQLNDLWQYNPTSNTWMPKTNFGGAARYDAAWFVIGNYAYVGTGYSPYSSDFWKYDPSTDTWTQIADVGGGARVRVAVGFAVDSFGYVACGGTQFVYYSTDLWCYDPSSNSWSQKAAFPGQGRVGPSAFAFSGNGYVGNGCTDVSVFNDFYSYNPATDSWSPIANFPGQGLIWSKGFSIGIYGYVGTGSDGIYPGGTDRADYWQYGPVDAPPVASFQSSITNICANDCINFTDQSTNASSWLWSFAGGTPSSSTDENPQNICYFVTGNYDVTLIVSNGSGSDTLDMTNYITVNAIPPTPDIIQSGDTLFCSTDPTYTSYQWYYYNTLIPGATDTSFLVSIKGNYNVEVTNENGCAIAGGINVILGLNEVEAPAYFTLCPNPATNQLTVHTSSFNTNEVVTVLVMNVVGQETSPLTPLQWRGESAVIDVSALSSGMYFLQLKGESGSVVKKFVKE